MAANTLKNPQTLSRAFRDFVFKPAFFVGLVVGFILGIIVSFLLGKIVSSSWSIVISSILSLVTGFFANSFWEKYKKRKRGSRPYYTINASEGIIRYEGQTQNTVSNQTAIFETIKKTFPSDR